MRVMKEQLCNTESREHRAKDLCIRSLALSGSCSLPLLTDAVCLSLCLALLQKTNAGNHCALSPAVLRLQHVTILILMLHTTSLSLQAIVGMDICLHPLVSSQVMLEVDLIQPENCILY